MMQQLLISDSNIIIDLDCCDLLKRMFDLPYTFAVPDILYVDELEHHHGDLPAYGLQVKSLEAEEIEYFQSLQMQYSKPSTYDLSALVLAKREDCPLVTGDNALRNAAQQENVHIRGTIWIIEKMISSGLISIERASQAFADMKENQRFLPWNEAERMLQRVLTEGV